MNIICRFCQQATRYSPIREMENINVKVHWCEVCQAEYLRFADSDKAYTCSLYTIINQRMYRWTTNAHGNAWLYYIKEPGVPGERPNRGIQWILTLNNVADKLTPQNINAKIRTYLLFL